MKSCQSQGFTMCGITGIISKKYGAENYLTLCRALEAIQHRGYDGCGIAWVDKQSSEPKVRRGCGKIADVLSNSSDPIPSFSVGVGHTRYKTSGEIVDSHTQPLICKCCPNDSSVVLVHNGHVHPRDASVKFEYDSAEIVKVFDGCETIENVLEALKTLHSIVWGSYSCILIHPKLGMLLFRDPSGIRPLVYANVTPETIIASSETVSFDCAPNPQNVKPGQLVWISQELEIHKFTFVDPQITQLTPCLFCFIYLAHVDGVLDGTSVKSARMRIGATMGERLLNKNGEGVDAIDTIDTIDVVVPIPKTSCVATKELANVLNKPFVTAINVRNQGRTFIVNGQGNREKAVQEKFSYDVDALRGKVVLLVDDSIVRGTTIRTVSRQLFELCGVSKVYVACLSPPVISPNRFGIDIPNKDLLIACKHDSDTDKIAKELEIDGLWYHDLETMVKAIKELNPRLDGFETSIFEC